MKEAAELLIHWAERRAQISRLALTLLEHEKLTGPQVAKILNGSM